MSKAPISIDIGAEIATALDARLREGETRAARLEIDLNTYHALLDEGMRRAVHSLSPADASLLLDVFNNTPLGQTWTAERMVMRVSDAIALDGLAEKRGIDGLALISTLHTLGDLPVLALADWADKIWDKADFDIAAETAIFKK